MLVDNLAGLPELAALAQNAAWSVPLTVAFYLIALWLFRRSRQSPLVNPVLLGMAGVMTTLHLTDTRYEDYFNGSQALHFLLGTATVALAIPLHQQLQHLRRTALPLILSVGAGSLTATLSTLFCISWLGGSELTMRSLAAKSTTTPVAMAIAEQLEGLPALAAVTVIITGILGAIFGLGILRLTGIVDPRAQGIAIGIAAHGIGTARALQVSHALGAYAGLGMGLSALFTAILVPPVWYVLGPYLVTG